MPARWLIGLASGVDGVETALLETEGAGLDLRARFLQATHQPYGRELCELVRKASGSGPCELRHAALLHRLLGETFAAAARQAADRASLSLARVQVIGLPGQTAWLDAESRFPAALSLGMAAVVAERTGVSTVSDFAARDLAVGGQGTPLAALPAYLLFRDAAEDRAVIDLGSRTRVLYLPARCRIHEVVGCEAGPCGILLDALMRHASGGQHAFDHGGKHAVQGRCLEPLLRRWLAHPYLQRRPPKGLPWAAFGEEFAIDAVQELRRSQPRGEGLHDLLCTATHFIAHLTADALRQCAPGRLPGCVLLHGGGVKNGLLWRLLEQFCSGVTLERTDRYGIPAEGTKAAAWALLAALFVDGVPASLPGVTGSGGSRLLGSLTPGSPDNWAACLAWSTGHAAA